MPLDSGIEISGTVMSLLSIQGDHAHVEMGAPSQCDLDRLCSEGLHGGDRGDSGDSDSVDAPS
jgi:hypothetical protein